MDIKDLEESQGLTAEMVREYLQRVPDREVHWEPSNNGAHMDAGYRPPATDTDPRMVWLWGDLSNAGAFLATLARHDGLSIQALLREINPRMRPAPSIAAWMAHGGTTGWWLIGVPRESMERHFVRLEPVEGLGYQRLRKSSWAFSSAPDSEWRFWPADQNANKVRWPCDANGVML